MPTRTLVAACVLAAGVAFALAYGVGYGTSNQQTYLLDPLVHAFPELYRRDWFVAEMHHYHVAFAFLTAPLYAVDPGGNVAFGIAQVVTVVATFAAIYGLVAAVTVRARLSIFLGLVGLLALGGGRSFGGSYLLAGYIQPSSLAVIGWLVALFAWVRDRPLAAGIALAAAGAFHLNYAMLGIGVFGLAELCSRRTSWRRLAVLLGPSLVVMIVFVPAMLASSSTSEPKLALDVLVKFAFPIHFKPARMRHEVWALAGWLVITWAMRPGSRGDALDRLWWFALCGMGTCLAAFLVVSIPPLLTLTRLFVWRIAPIPQLAGQLLLVLGVRAIAAGDTPRPRGWQLAALVVGASGVIYNAFSRPRGAYPEVITCVMVTCAVAIVLRRELIVRAGCAVVCAFALWTARAGIVAPQLFRSAEPGVTAWARTASPVDALFLAPPYYSEFRLLARRAVVVDLKSPPMYLDELVAWYRRLCAVADARELAALEEASVRWDVLPPERLVGIAHAFHADYIVLDKERTATRLAMTVAYEDDHDLVYAIPR